METIETDLTGKLLVAMPGMGDPRFARAVVFLCAHGADGAMGLIVNKPAPAISLADLFEQLSIEDAEGDGTPVHFGGPVEGARGFVLHSHDYEADEGTLEVSEAFRMTATLDVLRSMARGTGPARALVALGYAGWGPGQLETEIAENGWLVAEAATDIVFDRADRDKWRAAVETLGIDPLLLSSAAGSA